MIIKTAYGHCEYAFEKDYVHIYNLFVNPAHRKQGNARKLLRLAIGAIRDTGHKEKIQIVAKPSDKNIDVQTLMRFYKEEGLDVYTYYG